MNIRIVGAGLAMSVALALFAYPTGASAEALWKVRDIELCSQTSRGGLPSCVSVTATSTSIQATSSCTKAIGLFADIESRNGGGTAERRQYFGVTLWTGDSFSIDLANIVSPLEIASRSLMFSRVECCLGGNVSNNACATPETPDN